MSALDISYLQFLALHLSLTSLEEGANERNEGKKM